MKRYLRSQTSEAMTRSGLIPTTARTRVSAATYGLLWLFPREEKLP